MDEQAFWTVSDLVGEAQARHGLEVTPRLFSDLFYQRKLDARRCPIVGGRRLIPREYVDVILELLPSLIRKGEGQKKDD